MVERPPRRTHRHVVPGPLSLKDDHRAGEEVLHFTRWLLQSKYRLVGAFLEDLQTPAAERDVALIHARLSRALQHALRVQRVRAAVTLLLAFGILTTAASAFAELVGVAAPLEHLERVAAWAGSVSLLLIALRLLVDRYLARVDVALTFLSMQLAGAAR